jgi:general nucleoside transport system permease protein
MTGRVLTRAAVAVGAAVLAFLVIGALMAVDGVSPFEGYEIFYEGSLSSSVSLGFSLTSAVPYAMCALAFTLAFRCRLYNVGMEGQLLWGGLAAALVGIHVEAGGLTPVLALLAAAAAGGAWAAIPILLKLWTGASEIVSSLFLNYVAFFLMSALVGDVFLQEGSTVATTAPVGSDAELPVLVADTEITVATLVVLATGAAVWLILARSALGFRIRTIGANERVARRVGMDVRRTMITTFVASGAIAGAGGGLELLGNQLAMTPTFSQGWGYTGIAAALLGGATAVGSVVAGFFFGVLDAGASALQLDLDLPSALSQLAQALALLGAIVAAQLLERGVAARPRLRRRAPGRSRAREAVP